jgi:transposase
VVEIELKKKVIQFYQPVFRNKITSEKIKVDFPRGINAPIQFGNTVKSFAVYLRETNFLSYERLSVLFKEVFDIYISPGTLVNFVADAEYSHTIDYFEEAAFNNIINSPVINSDETGISVCGKKGWAHVWNSSEYTLVVAMKDRGTVAINNIGLLPKYKGTVVHDGCATYRTYEFTHALCNAHHIRELNLAEECGEKWAPKLRKLLVELNNLKIEHGGVVPLPLQKKFRNKFRKKIKEGIESTGGETIERPPGQKKGGRIKKSKSRNLLERFKLYEDDVLRFMTDEKIPFTNNDAERPIRMIKVHMKISGTFRSNARAMGYSSFYSFLLSSKKHKVSQYDAIKMAVENIIPDYIKADLGLDNNYPVEG